MAISSTIPQGDVTAVLNFFTPPADKSLPFNYVEDPPEGFPKTNFTGDPQSTTIHDIRGRESEYSLDRDAFQIIQDVPPSSELDFIDDDSIKANYYPEIEQLLLNNVAGSNRVFIFDHTIRRQKPDAHRLPVTRVHIDQTAEAVAQRIRRYFPDEADELLKRRYRLINVWRPLNKKPLESFPLAVASSASVEDDDVVPVQHLYADGYRGWTAAIRHNPEQKWYYLSGMKGSERLLLECFDSESLKPGSKIKGRVPHTAFEDPRTRPEAEGRESIEIL
ncbi:hypothetical protein ACLX1H_002291 [Fusarium chlamydosporum]